MMRSPVKGSFNNHHHNPYTHHTHHHAKTNPLWSWIPDSWPQRLFILINLTEAVVNISIEAVLLSRFNASEGGLTDKNTKNLRALPVFVLCFCLAHSYQVLLSFDACLNRNTILVAGLTLFNLCFLVYSIIQIGEIRLVLGDGVARGSGQTVPVQILTGAIPCVIAAAQVAYFILGWYLWKDFGWQIYKSIIGADRTLKRAYMQYQVYVALLKFDFFVFLAFCLQLVLVVLTSDPVEKILTIIATPLTLFLLIFAWWSVRHENKPGMLVFLTGLCGAGFYFSWKLWRIWSEKDGIYLEVYKSLTVFCVIALCLTLSTAILSLRCMLNFKRGLQQSMDRAKLERKSAQAAGIRPAFNGFVGASGSKGDLLPLSSNSTVHLPAQPRISLD
ncbi:unnamed protein product [Sympodiomycopsis kandeliae]